MASNDITSIESVDGFSVSQDSPFYADIKQTVSPDGAVDGYTVKFNQGYIFGDQGRGFQRINIACPREVLELGLWRLKEAIEKLKV